MSSLGVEHTSWGFLKSFLFCIMTQVFRISATATQCQEPTARKVLKIRNVVFRAMDYTQTFGSIRKISQICPQVSEISLGSSTTTTTNTKTKLSSTQSSHLTKTKWYQDKSGTMSSTDPTSYLEDRVVLDKVPDVQFSSNFHSRLTWPRLNDFRTNQEPSPLQIQHLTWRTG